MALPEMVAGLMIITCTEYGNAVVCSLGTWVMNGRHGRRTRLELVVAGTRNRCCNPQRRAAAIRCLSCHDDLNALASLHQRCIYALIRYTAHRWVACWMHESTD